MSRRRRSAEHENHERWLVSYADFITLLFAFFVVLYASAEVDNRKVAEVAAAIQGGFQDLGVFVGTKESSATRNGRGEAVSLPVNAKVTTPLPKPPLPGQLPGIDLSTLRQQLEVVLGEEIRKHEIQMHSGGGGLIISLREIGFFNSGEATLLPGSDEVLGRLAKTLGSHGFEVRVEGHTDNVPIHSSRFKSNWELSTARATEVVSILVEQYNLDPHLISGAGYSEYRPVADNDTEEGRKLNRRVDLVVVPPVAQ